MNRWNFLAGFLIFSVLVSCFPIVPGDPSERPTGQVRLTLLETSDIHSRLLPYDFAPIKTDQDLGLIPEAGPFGGATRVASILKRERIRADRVLHLDSGDSFEGAPVFNVNGGEVEYKFLSLVGVDAAVIGNHEFDLGIKNFTTQVRNSASFPVLAANYLWKNIGDLGSSDTGKFVQPYTIRNVKGLRVGIIGLANVSSLNSLIEGGNTLQASPLEQNESIRGYVELLRPVVDVVMVVSHAGLTEDQDLVRGYEAFYFYGDIKGYLHRSNEPWSVLEWFGPQEIDTTLVRVHVPGVTGLDVILGGHLHVVLNPPQLLSDPSGRKVILSHGGAFAKFVNRIDLVLQMPPNDSVGQGAEVIGHEFKVFPIDALWCNDALHDFYKAQFWNPGEFIRDPAVVRGLKDCQQQEDAATTRLLEPYIIRLNQVIPLTDLFAYAPREIARRNSSTGGDSPLGNITADSMRFRKRVEAEVAITNSLGIRDNLYAGPLTREAMFNVFPFENTINIMKLSGRELQETFDFVSEKSADRGCVSQAQISGASVTLDCAQVQLNALRISCDPSKGVDAVSSCPHDDRSDRAPWECIDDIAGSRCWAHPATHIAINGSPLDLNGTYRVAVNDYIAKGGSGFKVLKRNTTREETGISLRDAIIGYMEDFCSCDDILSGNTDAQGNTIGKKGQFCGSPTGDKWVVDQQLLTFCQSTRDFQKGMANLPGPNLGKCTCQDALASSPVCGYVTDRVRAFCQHPTTSAIAIANEDGRIARRVK